MVPTNTASLSDVNPVKRGWHARPTGLMAVAVFALTFLVYNANGREIGNYDSQPTKFTAVELAVRHTLILDAVVARAPALALRPGFAKDRDGHYRSAYPILPGVIAGGVALGLRGLGLADPAALHGANLVAKLTASSLTALAVSFVFLLARRRLASAPALLIALGFGLGTNLWAGASQTLWQTETAVAALSGVALCLAFPATQVTTPRLWIAALLLGVAGAARPQLAPAIAVLALSIAVGRRRRADLLALIPLAGMAGAVVSLNLLWFGHPLGAIPQLEALHPTVHAVGTTFANPLWGAAGLLFSPSRGILVFSPIVAIVLAAWPALRRTGWRDDLRWWCGAAVAQFVFYSCYSVWWAGHTYGPRYLLDILPLLVPLAAAGMTWVLARQWRRRVAAIALVWSIVIAGTGAFVYPNELWNQDPADVDLNHERLWQWRDPQFVRCWFAAPSPQNFTWFRNPLLQPGPGDITR